MKCAHSKNEIVPKKCDSKTKEPIHKEFAVIVEEKCEECDYAAESKHATNNNNKFLK